MLVLMCGLPGTGKSTVAEAIRKRMSGELIRTDEVRKQLFEKPEYTEEEKAFVYDEILKMAELLLKRGNVIIDGTFYRKDARKKFYGAARKTDLKIVECICDEKIIFERMKYRTNDPSDADYRVYRKIKSQWEPISEKHMVIDTGKEWEKRLDEF